MPLCDDQKTDNTQFYERQTMTLKNDDAQEVHHRT